MKVTNTIQTWSSFASLSLKSAL